MQHLLLFHFHFFTAVGLIPSIKTFADLVSCPGSAFPFFYGSWPISSIRNKIGGGVGWVVKYKNKKKKKKIKV